MSNSILVLFQVWNLINYTENSKNVRDRRLRERGIEREREREINLSCIPGVKC